MLAVPLIAMIYTQPDAGLRLAGLMPSSATIAAGITGAALVVFVLRYRTHQRAARRARDTGASGAR